MSDIPCELHREILVWVTAMSLLRFRAVCKEWRRLISDPSFIKSHTNNLQFSSSSTTTLLIRGDSEPYYLLSLDSNLRETIDPTPAGNLNHLVADWSPVRWKVLSSCNGLMLMQAPNAWIIWNPLIGKFHKVPPPPLDVFAIGSGLGYDYTADDYKVVRIGCLSRTQIYSLKSDSWRILGDCSNKMWFYNVGAVFLNGCLHWIARDETVVLDVGTEDYHQLSVPPVVPAEYWCEPSLDALGGCLFASYIDHKRRCVEGWVMNEEKSWTKWYSITNQDVYCAKPMPAAYLRHKQHLLLQLPKSHDFFWVDLQNDYSVKKLTVNGVSNILDSHLCSGSLFLLEQTLK